MSQDVIDKVPYFFLTLKNKQETEPGKWRASGIEAAVSVGKSGYPQIYA